MKIPPFRFVIVDPALFRPCEALGRNQTELYNPRLSQYSGESADQGERQARVPEEIDCHGGSRWIWLQSRSTVDHERRDDTGKKTRLHIAVTSYNEHWVRWDECEGSQKVEKHRGFRSTSLPSPWLSHWLLRDIKTTNRSTPLES
jgi:hypothetical protein